MEATYRLVELVLRQPLRRALRWRVEGVDRLPPRGPVLLASNHVSYFDPIAVANLTDLAGRRARFLAKAELFENRFMAAALHRMGQIPVERGRGDTGALDTAAAALHSGRCLAVFPEGTISDDLNPMAGKTGIARLARSAGVDVVPVGLWGTHRVLPAKGQKREVLRTPIVVVVGEPIRIGPDANPRESTDRIMGGICAAVSEARRLYPAPPAGQVDAWWVRSPRAARLRSCRGTVAQARIDAQYENGLSGEGPSGEGPSGEGPSGEGPS